MKPDELLALADALEPMARAPRFEDFDVPAFCAWVRACADAKPVRAVPLGHALSAVRHVGSANYPDRERAAIERLCSAEFDAYTHPAPAAPQAEPKREPLSDEQIDELGDPFGYFQYGDAQGDKRRAFVRAIEHAHGISGGGHD